MKLYGIDGGGWAEVKPGVRGSGPTVRRAIGAPSGSQCLHSIEPPAASRPYMHRPAWKLYFAGLCFWLALATWLLW